MRRSRSALSTLTRRSPSPRFLGQRFAGCCSKESGEERVAQLHCHLQHNAGQEICEIPTHRSGGGDGWAGSGSGKYGYPTTRSPAPPDLTRPRHLCQARGPRGRTLRHSTALVACTVLAQAARPADIQRLFAVRDPGRGEPTAVAHSPWEGLLRGQRIASVFRVSTRSTCATRPYLLTHRHLSPRFASLEAQMQHRAGAARGRTKRRRRPGWLMTTQLVVPGARRRPPGGCHVGASRVRFDHLLLPTCLGDHPSEQGCLVLAHSPAATQDVMM